MKYLRRLLWFMATKLMLYTAAIGLLIIAFYFAMNTANAYILLNDGMNVRAGYNLMRVDEAELSNYFTARSLESDEFFQKCRSPNSIYLDYNITGYNHSISMGIVETWPWSDRATTWIEDRVTRINGSPVSDQVKPAPPDYMNCRYDVELVRVDGRWIIDRIVPGNRDMSDP